MGIRRRNIAHPERTVCGPPAPRTAPGTGGTGMVRLGERSKCAQNSRHHSPLRVRGTGGTGGTAKNDLDKKNSSVLRRRAPRHAPRAGLSVNFTFLRLISVTTAKFQFPHFSLNCNFAPTSSLCTQVAPDSSRSANSGLPFAPVTSLPNLRTGAIGTYRQLSGPIGTKIAFPIFPQPGVCLFVFFRSVIRVGRGRVSPRVSSAGWSDNRQFA